MTVPLSDTQLAVRLCGQCGRSGTRGFTVRPAGPVNTAVGEVWIDELVQCTNRTACQKRWPRRPSDDD